MWNHAESWAPSIGWIACFVFALLAWRARAELRTRSLELRFAQTTVDRMAHEQWAFLAESFRELSSSLEPTEILGRIVRLAVPGFADACAVSLNDRPEWPGQLVVHASSPALEASLREHLSEMVTKSNDALSGPIWVGELRRPLAPGLAKGMRLRSWIQIPLGDSGHQIGTLSFACGIGERRLRAEDLVLAEKFADRATLALANSRLFQQSKRMAEMRQEMVAIVSHDLRTPLTLMTLHLSLLQSINESENPDRSLIAKSYRSIDVAIQRMMKMIQDLLSLARIEAGKFQIETAREDANALIQGCIEYLKPLAENRSIALVAEARVNGDIEFDRERVFQVVQNLVGNALKFTPPGGRIVIRAEGGTQEGAKFTIEDTGPGIPVESRKRIFDPYWQLQGREGSGSGLGLAIARGLVEAHGGRLWLDETREEGQGAAFCFSIPRARPAFEVPGCQSAT